MIRDVSACDSRNQVIQATLGDGAFSHTADYYDASGQMKAITVTGPSGPVHDLRYTYDSFGNLRKRPLM